MNLNEPSVMIKLAISVPGRRKSRPIDFSSLTKMIFSWLRNLGGIHQASSQFAHSKRGTSRNRFTFPGSIGRLF